MIDHLRHSKRLCAANADAPAYRHHPIGWRASLAALSVCLAVPALASDPATPDGATLPQTGATTHDLGDIIVTAQKRREDITHIPISISVLDSGAIKTKQIANYDDISRAIPGVSLNEGGAPGTSVLEMRGISSTSGAATVGIYVDEVPITVNNTVYDGNTEPRLFDVDRVEVLRGPQGTLYGASSLGGTIRFITKAPDLDKFGGEISAGGSSTSHGGVNGDFSGIINVPLVEGKLAFRGGLSYTSDSGYIDNYDFTTGALKTKGTNWDHPLSGRASLLFQATDTLSITAALLYQRDKFGDTSLFYPALGLWEQNKQVRENGKDTLYVPSLTVKADLGAVDLTSVTSYFDRHFKRMTDGTFFNSGVIVSAFLDPAYPQFAAQADARLANLPSPVPYDIHHHQFTQELRLSSPDRPGSRLKWVAGLYYSNYWEERSNNGTIPGFSATFQDIYGFNINDSVLGVPDNPHLFDNDLVYYELIHTYQQRYAAFGQADYAITDKLHATLGARYEYAHTKANFIGQGFYNVGNPNQYSTSTNNKAFNPKFSLSYDIAPRSSIYATIAKGFRLGGPTGPTPRGDGNPCSADYAALGITNPPSKFGPDKLWSYEAGVKSRLFDNRLSVNAAAYYIDWQKLQQTIVLPTCGFTFTSNVGDAESYGGELEIMLKALRQLTLGFNGSVDHAAITKTTNASTAAVGQKVLNVPEWTANFTADYDIPLGDDFAALLHADYDMIGPSHGTYIVSNPNYRNPEYGVLNANIAITRRGYKLSLFAKNLLNDKTIIQQPTENSVITGYTVRPRTVGASLTKDF